RNGKRFRRAFTTKGSLWNDGHGRYLNDSCCIYGYETYRPLTRGFNTDSGVVNTPFVTGNPSGQPGKFNLDVLAGTDFQVFGTGKIKTSADVHAKGDVFINGITFGHTIRIRVAKSTNETGVQWCFRNGPDPAQHAVNPYKWHA